MSIIYNMPSTADHNIPWELISASFLGSLSGEEAAILQIWLSAKPENQEIFLELEQLWKDGLNDYSIYQKANPEDGWNTLKYRLENFTDTHENEKVIQGQFSNSYYVLLKWMSIASIFLLVIAGLFWYNTRTGKSMIYQTTNGELSTIALPDGSTMVLQPNSKIKIAPKYNGSAREVSFFQGEVFFEVIHNNSIPFIVNMGLVSVKDIGTGFTIKKDKDSIVVKVSSGEVAFINHKSKEEQYLTAGMSLSYLIRQNKFTKTSFFEVGTAINNSQLKFSNTPLVEVIESLEKAFKKKIFLADSALADKGFTANLDGQSFEEALLILCKSLDLEYSEINSTYQLFKNKSSK